MAYSLRWTLTKLTLANRRWLPSQGKLDWSWMREVYAGYGLVGAYATFNFT